MKGEAASRNSVNFKKNALGIGAGLTIRPSSATLGAQNRKEVLIYAPQDRGSWLGAAKSAG
jgi:hypothetical protein